MLMWGKVRALVCAHVGESVSVEPMWGKVRTLVCAHVGERESVSLCSCVVK